MTASLAEAWSSGAVFGGACLAVTFAWAFCRCHKEARR